MQTMSPVMVTSSAQTEISLPRRIEAIWHCHGVGSETVVDCGEVGVPLDGIAVETGHSEQVENVSADDPRQLAGPNVEDVDSLAIAEEKTNADNTPEKRSENSVNDSPGIFDFDMLEDSERSDSVDLEDDDAYDEMPDLGVLDSDTEDEEVMRQRHARIKRLHKLTRTVRSALARRRIRLGRARGDEDQLIEVSVEEKVQRYEEALRAAVQRDRERHPEERHGGMMADIDSIDPEGLSSGTSNDYVQDDFGPVHLHRGREDRNGREVLWREGDDGTLDIHSLQFEDRNPTRASGVATTSGVSLVSGKLEPTHVSGVATAGGVSLVNEKLEPMGWNKILNIGRSSRWNLWSGVMSDAMFKVWVKANVREEFIDMGIGKSEQEILEIMCDDDDIINPDRYIDVVTKPGRPQGSPTQTKTIGGRRFRLARGITVDSGAADNVIARRMLRGKCSKVRPSAASKAGVHYVAANEGEADMMFTTQEGNQLNWTFQVAEVNKVLAAVSSLVDTNHRVVFDRDEKTKIDVSFIIDKTTGTVTKLRRERNVWVVDAWIEEPIPDTGFARPS